MFIDKSFRILNMSLNFILLMGSKFDTYIFRTLFRDIDNFLVKVLRKKKKVSFSKDNYPPKEGNMLNGI